MSGGLPIVYWLLEVPFILYGFMLTSVATRSYREGNGRRLTAGLTLVGLSFHLLGPAVDFPVFDPMAFVVYGGAMTALVSVSLVGRWLVAERHPAGD